MNPIEQTTKGIRLEVGPEFYNHLKSVQNQLRDVEDRKRSLAELVLILAKRGMQASNDWFNGPEVVYSLDVEDPVSADFSIPTEDSVQDEPVQTSFQPQILSDKEIMEDLGELGFDLELERKWELRQKVIMAKMKKVITGELYNPVAVQNGIPFPEFPLLAFHNGTLLPRTRIHLPFREARSLLNKPEGMSDYEWLMSPQVEWFDQTIDKYARPTAFPWPDHYHKVFDWADNTLNEQIRKFLKIMSGKKVKKLDLQYLFFDVQDWLRGEIYQKVLPKPYPYRRAFEVLLYDRIRGLLLIMEAEGKEEMSFKWKREDREPFIELLLWLDKEANLSEDWLERIRSNRAA